ncbi:MAG: type I-E CRISPR-associated protein Cas6/Cse3/CasE [Acidobacteria bacterium]|nr:type I-E CRISPR-associated protein Cas6/Cse3/CasE [Acidobacteriota bacterium]
MDFSGMLFVINPKAFAVALHKGIGPAKAFGCGLMLVRRI